MGTRVRGQLINETYPEACFDSVFLHKFLERKKSDLENFSGKIRAIGSEIHYYIKSS